MKRIYLFLCTFLTCDIISSAQDMFTARQLTSDPAQEGFATWSLDGKFIVFQHTNMYDTLDKIGKNGLWRVSADGSGAKQIFRGLAEHAKCHSDTIGTEHLLPVCTIHGLILRIIYSIS